MEIKFKESWKIQTVEEWIKKFDKSKKDEDGKSAKSLAEFCARDDAEQILKSILEPILGNEVSFEFVMPEYQTKFDNYGKGRMHDLVIKGKNDKGTFSVGVEAKVNESFGSKLCNQYDNSLKKEKTYFPERINNMLSNYFPQITTESDLPYQLFYSTLACTKIDECDQFVFLVLVFNTDVAIEKTISKNKSTFDNFMSAIHAKQMNIINGSEYYEAHIGEKTLNIIYSKINL